MQKPTEIIEDKAILIQRELGLKLIELKREASGALINSLTHTVLALSEFAYTVEIKALDYWKYVNYGVSGQNIPYEVGRRSGAKSSAYIDGLIKWLKIKGIASDNKVVRSIAFAIAYNQTAKGGLGKGNPINKGKLGFVEKTQTARDRYVQEMAEAVNMQVVTMVKGLTGEIKIFI
mgnify:CR=1 FL=1|tara:strand:+ start:312 stop:839 length:528 start_codon:yes stop_codon:yes gene_type:complete